MIKIGYHATHSGHRGSLTQGLRVVESAWDPGSGGELGQGFYIIAGEQTAALYSYGVAIALTAGMQHVDIWAVWCDVELTSLESFDVPTALQWDRMTPDLCERYDYLTNANENPKAQLKFNPRAYRHLDIRLQESLSLQAADQMSDVLAASATS